MDASAIDETLFLAPLKARREDALFQSTPIKRHRVEIRDDESKDGE